MARNTCIRQRDSSDCGPACITSVLAHFGISVPVSRVRHEARTDTRGTTMSGMVQALNKFDFEARGLKGVAENLDKLPLPFIAHLVLSDGMQHYVAIYKIKVRGLKIMNPAVGKMSMSSWADFNTIWSGSVIALVPANQPLIEGIHISKSTRIFSLIRPVWKPVLQAVISAVLYTVLGLSSSIYLGRLIDDVFVTHNEGLLNLLSLAMVSITLVMVFLSSSRNVIVLKTGQVIDNQLITSYYRHLFNLPQRFFDSMKTGEIISRINDAVKIRGFVNDAAVGILVNLLILLFSFSAMFLLHSRLASIMLSMIPFYTLIYIIFNLLNKRIERKVMERSAILEDQFIESLRVSTHIRQSNLQMVTRHKTERRLNRLLDSVYQSGINAIAASTASEAVNRLYTIILLWAGSFFVIRESLTPGNLLTFYALMGYCTGPVSGLISANKTYQNAMIAADRLFEIFYLDREQKPGIQAFKPDQFGDIVFRGVSFAYGSRGEQLKQVDLTIKSGQVTVLTGPSGSGKSTIARLVQHLYPADSGQITINGLDTRYYSLESIRSLMGVVPQQISFLSDTIIENIAPGETEPNLSRVIRLLDKVGLLKVIESLPEGLNSKMSRNGENFSGGERQRLALVRALYGNPPLLILDEPTSSLDHRWEVEVYRIMLSLKENNKTLLLVTHKPRYTALADVVCRMDQGQIISIQSGPS